MVQRIIPVSFYNRETVVVARELLGKLLIRRINKTDLVGEIVETEAYLGSFDLAAHSRFGLTKRNAPTFGPPGRAYVFLIYGIYCCLNVVTEKVGSGSAVLIRAVSLEGHSSLRTSGPGLVCKAFRIDRSFNHTNLTKKGSLYIAEAISPQPDKKETIVSAPRVGVAYAGRWKDKPLRFLLKLNH